MPRYAAIDIGSNSVRLAVADVSGERGMQMLATDREVTRLGTSVFSDGSISREATELVCRTLQRFRLTFERHHAIGVRAVATSAVRDARNQAEFLERASQAAGTTVEIISGVEEARLIHSGVQAVWPQPDQRILIVDIGGGSAEVIVSENGRLTAATSKPLGAVRLTSLFLENDPPLPQDLDRLNSFVDEKLADFARKIGKGDFDRVIATSATAAAVICAVNGIGRRDRDTADGQKASAAQIGRLLHDLTSKKLAARRKIPGIGPRRAEIVIAGTAVLYRILRTFGARAGYYSTAGVREGILADLGARRVGASLSRLSKEQRKIVETMAGRFGVNVQHARKTAEIAGILFEDLKPWHGLTPASGKLLEAAAYLSDIGHFVSDMGHHKHSYYLVSNADLPAFTAEEREILAQLCRFHRKSMPSIRYAFFTSLSPEKQRQVTLLVPLLRLADALDRSHNQRVAKLAVQLQPSKVIIALQSAADTNLELWAGEQAGEVFQQVYGKELVLQRTLVRES